MAEKETRHPPPIYWKCDGAYSFNEKQTWYSKAILTEKVFKNIKLRTAVLYRLAHSLVVTYQQTLWIN